MNVSCQCGDVQFRTPAEKPLGVYHCHCRECRRQSSSAYGTSAVFAVGDMSFLDSINDKLSVYIRPGGRSRTGRDMACYFCTQCGARVIHRYLRASSKTRADKGTKAVASKGGTASGSLPSKDGNEDSCGGGGDGYTRHNAVSGAAREQPRVGDLKESDFDGTTFTIKGGLIADLDYTSAIHIYTERAVVAVPNGVEQYLGTPPGSP